MTKANGKQRSVHGLASAQWAQLCTVMAGLFASFRCPCRKCCCRRSKLRGVQLAVWLQTHIPTSGN
eukprot:7093213-Prorocentrum_lima.AAC.1